MKAIKPAAERLNAKGKDTSDLSNFWRENEEGKGIDAFATVLRAVLVALWNMLRLPRMSEEGSPRRARTLLLQAVRHILL